MDSSQEEILKFLAENGDQGLHFTTVGHSDAIFVPAGWLFCELNGLLVNFGLKIGVLEKVFLVLLQYCADYVRGRGQANTALECTIQAFRTLIFELY